MQVYIVQIWSKLRQKIKRMENFLSEVVKTVRPKPRSSGMTMVLDRLGYNNLETMRMLSDFADIVKIGWGLPFLLGQDILKQHVGMYKMNHLHVSNGGTLLEYCVSKSKEAIALKNLSTAGFDTIELSEGVLEIPYFTKKKIAEFAHANNLRLHVEVGRKNPRNQLSLEETISRIEQSFEFGPDIILVEGRESGRSVGIYDDLGGIKWDWVERLEEISDPSKLMFEAPQEVQQTELIIHIGSEVNLGNVGIPSIGALETQRQGLRGDTLGASSGSNIIKGGPATKFVYFAISSHGALDQSKVMRLTGLNRRTVQESLKKLLKQGAVRESVDPNDLRKKVYSA
jgi:phosphosulfolactate synthase